MIVYFLSFFYFGMNFISKKSLPLLNYFKKQMKNILVAILCLICVCSQAQLLDSAALTEIKMYKSLKEAKQAKPDSVIRLTIQFKKIDSLGMELSKFKNLQELHLKNIRMEEIPKEIFGLKNLVFLEISNCKLMEIPDDIGELTNLTHLILSQNYLIRLPASFKYLKKLEYLDIWSNSIDVFPNEISELKDNLRIVDMRVIYMNDLRKEDLQTLLPKTTFYFSQSCNCQ
jgi:Leucine-rich repeat (LRR) protein